MNKEKPNIKKEDSQVKYDKVSILNVKPDKKGKMPLNMPDGLKIEYIPLDVTLSCENIYMLISDNGFVNLKYYKFLFFFFYITLVIVNLNITSIILYVRVPNNAFKYECYKPSINSYDRCTSRNWCMCSDLNKCVRNCYSSAANCTQDFTNAMQELTRFGVYGTRLYVRYEEAEKTNLNVFNGILNQHCYVRIYSLYIIMMIFLGGVLGCPFFGIFADLYGKKVILISQSICVFCIEIVISIYSFRKYNDYSNESYFLTIWMINGFLLGFFFFSMESLIYLQFLENLPYVNYYGSINGYFHTNFGLVFLITIFFYFILKNYSGLFLFTAFYFLAFCLIYIFYFTENPRFLSEKKDFIAKKQSLKKLIQEITLAERKINDSDEREKFYKVLVLFDSTKEKFVKKNQIQLTVPEIKNEIRKSEVRIKKSNKSNDKRKLGGLFSTSIKDKIEKRNSSKFLKENINNISKINSTREGKKKDLKKASRKSTNPTKKIEYLEDISFAKIWNGLQTDKFMSKNSNVILWGWMGLNYCFYGSVLGLVLEITNPNSLIEFRSFGLIVYSSLMLGMLPLIGKISYFLAPHIILKICLFIYSLLVIRGDIHKIFPENERDIFFGGDIEQSNQTSLPFNQATSCFFILIAYAQYDLMTLNSAPTMYRTFFFSICKSFSKLTGFLALITRLQLDAPGLNFGIVGCFILLMFFWVDVKWKDMSLIEFCDSDRKIRKRDKSNDRESQESEIDPLRSGSLYIRFKNINLRKRRNNFKS
jgi:hypothetical protein